MTDRNSEITGTVLREPSDGTDARKTPMSGKSKATCKQEPGAVMPVVDFKQCEGKGDCVRVCPEDVFEIRRIEEVDYRGLGLLHRLKQRVHGMQVAYTPNGDACRACGLCVAACPERAITLSRGME
jgi:NAD-dependent dihydropyrimidine dehydrogenase PreA subunit